MVFLGKKNFSLGQLEIAITFTIMTLKQEVKDKIPGVNFRVSTMGIQLPVSAAV